MEGRAIVFNASRKSGEEDGGWRWRMEMEVEELGKAMKCGENGRMESHREGRQEENSKWKRNNRRFHRFKQR